MGERELLLLSGSREIFLGDKHIAVVILVILFSFLDLAWVLRVHDIWLFFILDGLSLLSTFEWTAIRLVLRSECVMGFLEGGSPGIRNFLTLAFFIVLDVLHSILLIRFLKIDIPDINIDRIFLVRPKFPLTIPLFILSAMRIDINKEDNRNKEARNDKREHNWGHKNEHTQGKLTEDVLEDPELRVKAFQGWEVMLEKD